MEKILQYIREGKGRGLIFLLAVSVVLSFLSVHTARKFCTEVERQMDLLADEFLPITVENGKIVSPENTYKRVDFKIDDTDSHSEGIPIVLDTRTKESAVPDAKIGFFMMTDVVYIVSPAKIDRHTFPDGVWDKTRVLEVWHSSCNVLYLLLAVFAVVFFFVLLFIKVLFIAWLSRLILKAKKETGFSDFAMFMRAGSLAVVLIETLKICLGITMGVALNVNWLLTALISLTIAVGLMRMADKKEA